METSVFHFKEKFLPYEICLNERWAFSNAEYLASIYLQVFAAISFDPNPWLH